jgi:trehalose 6-phosphate synthase/phosphatase
MHIVSYRGPGMAGGVSAALARAWESNLGSGGQWWHIAENELKVAAGPRAIAQHVANIPEEVIKGHYRFCNEFLWPVMHDLPQYVNYVAEDRAYYDTFNNTLGWCLIRAFQPDFPRDYFVQDYQLTLLPAFLRDNAGFRSMMFWHIPWPKNVAAEHVPQIVSVARGMLGASAIGFHTDEYAENFMRFVAEYLPEYSCSEDSMAIWSTETFGGISNIRRLGSHGTMRGARGGQPTSRTQVTRLVVAPLGIDYDHWQSMASSPLVENWHPVLAKTPFILSVDRADYTKGVVDRIKAIDCLLENHPEWAGRIVFAQICGKTRTGLQSFDGYWDESHRLYKELCEKWGNESWQPLIWLESSFSSAELAKIYRSAEAMLVNAVRDGLNLTAKEFVACQDQRAGVLALSKGTGAYYELGSHTVNVEPGNIQQIADSIHSGLMMGSHERAWRMAMLKEKVKSNSLSGWWYRFSQLMQNRREQDMDDLLVRESS